VLITKPMTGPSAAWPRVIDAPLSYLAPGACRSCATFATGGGAQEMAMQDVLPLLFVSRREVSARGGALPTPAARRHIRGCRQDPPRVLSIRKARQWGGTPHMPTKGRAMRNAKKRTTVRKLNDADMKAAAGGTDPGALLHTNQGPDNSSWIDRLIFRALVASAKA